MKLFRTNFLLLILLLGFISCREEAKELVITVESRTEILPYFQDPSFTPVWLEINSDSLERFHKIPSFSLVNQQGDIVTDKTFENKIYVADFFFTSCPGICPKMTQNMGLIQEAFLEDDQVMLLSHSVTPEIDSPEILQNYATLKGVVKDKWHLVTGDRKEIYSLGRQAYFVEEDLGLPVDENDFLHTENFILVDKQKHIRGIYNGLNRASVAQLIADIKILKEE